MSFTLDVNPNAPSTTLTALLATVKANVPATKVDGGATWDCWDVTVTTRNGKPCFSFIYYVGGTGAASNIYVYHNKQLIGVYDYPVIFSIDNLPFPAIPIAQFHLSTVNKGYATACFQEFAWPSASSSINIVGFGAKSWGAQIKIQPTPTVMITPGIKYYETQWAVKYSDVEANVPGNPNNPLDATNIAASYTVVGPGSAGTFQGDFNDAMDAIIDKLGEMMSAGGIAGSLAQLETKISTAVDKLELIATVIDPALGEGSENLGLKGAVEVIAVAVHQFPAAAATALGPILESSLADPIVSSLDDIASAGTEEGGRAGDALEDIASKLFDPDSHQNIAQKVGGSGDGIDLTGLEQGLQDITDQLVGLDDVADIAQAIVDKEIPTTDVGGLETAIGALEQTVVLEAESLIAALPDAGGNGLAAVSTEIHDSRLGILEAMTVGIAGGAGVSIFEWLVSHGTSVLTVLEGIAAVTGIIHDLADTFLTKKFDVTGDAKTLLTAIKAALEGGLNPETGALLLQVVEAIDGVEEAVHTGEVNVSEAIDQVAGNLVDLEAGKNLAEKLELGDTGVDLSGVEAELGNIADQLEGVSDIASIATAIDDKEIDFPEEPDPSEAIAAAAEVLAGKVDELKDALPGAGATAVEDLALVLQSKLDELVAAGLAWQQGADGIDTIAGWLIDHGPDKLSLLSGVSSIVGAIEDLVDKTGATELDFSDDLSELLQAIRDTIAASSGADDQPYLKQIRDSLGWQAPPGENPYEDSVRGQLKRVFDGLFIVDEDTQEEISLAQLIADFNLQVKWPDVKFQYP